MTKRTVIITGFVLLVGCGGPTAPTSPPESTISLTLRFPTEPPPMVLGTRPPEWDLTEWINTEPLRLADLRGKVVLVRWFTGPWCFDCSATAPALRAFHERYADLGLAVIGMFHNSDSATLAEVRGHAETYGYRFPIAIDRETATRKRWCLGDDSWATSVTFVLDRKGVVRHIHSGGRYVKGDSEYRVMEATIERLLFEGPGEEAEPDDARNRGLTPPVRPL